MPLDTASTEFLARLAEGKAPPLHQLSPGEARARGPILKQLFGEGPPMHRTERTTIGRGDGAFDVHVLTPNAEPKAVIVYYHGGGWVIGDIDEFETLGRKLAQRSGCAVVMVNYRLAPEHPFPLPVDDCREAFAWAARNVERIAGRRVPLIVAGDSAGGTLATVVARHARDAGGPPIALQVLVYPATDADEARPSYNDPQNQLLLGKETMRWFWNHYAPAAHDRLHPDASPLRAADLAGMPPAVILTAEFDPLRDEGEAYAGRLLAAGVPVVFRRCLGQMHGFFMMVNVLPASERAIDEIARQIDAALASQAPQ